MRHQPSSDVVESVGARIVSIAVATGLVTGVAAGLIGVGGGEFRLPALVRLLRLPLRLAGGVNLLIGLCTVIVSVLRRGGQHPWARDDVALIVVMGTVSIFGAILGCLFRNRVPIWPLKSIVTLYLTLVGCWMLYEAVAHVDHVLLEPKGAGRWAMAGVVGFVIAVVSGLLGVAGGEMRIPALLYLFAVPIKEAGTLSLFVSVPTVAAGAVTDLRIGRIPDRAFRIAIFMSAASIIGVLIGAALLPYVDRDTLKGILGVILLVATVRLTAPVAPDGRSRSRPH